MALGCFHNLLKDKDFVNEFKDYVKGLYKDMRSRGIDPKSLGLPSNWANANRQINRMIARAEGKNIQSRSGKRAYEGYMKQWLNDFLEKSFDDVAKDCLRGRGFGEGQDKPVGLWGGLYDLSDRETLGDYRGSFSDWNSLKNYVGELLSVAPVYVSVACSKHVYVSGSA